MAQTEQIEITLDKDIDLQEIDIHVDATNTQALFAPLQRKQGTNTTWIKRLLSIYRSGIVSIGLRRSGKRFTPVTRAVEVHSADPNTWYRYAYGARVDSGTYSWVSYATLLPTGYTVYTRTLTGAKMVIVADYSGAWARIYKLNGIEVTLVRELIAPEGASISVNPTSPNTGSYSTFAYGGDTVDVIPICVYGALGSDGTTVVKYFGVLSEFAEDEYLIKLTQEYPTTTPAASSFYTGLHYRHIVLQNKTMLVIRRSGSSETYGILDIIFSGTVHLSVFTRIYLVYELSDGTLFMLGLRQGDSSSKWYRYDYSSVTPVAEEFTPGDNAIQAFAPGPDADIYYNEYTDIARLDKNDTIHLIPNTVTNNQSTFIFVSKAGEIYRWGFDLRDYYNNIVQGLGVMKYTPSVQNPPGSGYYWSDILALGANYTYSGNWFVREFDFGLVFSSLAFASSGATACIVAKDLSSVTKDVLPGLQATGLITYAKK